MAQMFAVIMSQFLHLWNEDSKSYQVGLLQGLNEEIY